MTTGAAAATGTLLLVGVAAYDDPAVADLEATRRQVELVRAAFEGAGFAARSPLVGRVTRADADSFFADAGPVDDVVVVYWAGHGVRVGHEGWLLTAESVASSPSADTALSAVDVARYVTGLRGARRVLLVLDCCGAGSIGAVVGNAVAGGPDQPWQGEGGPPEVAVIAASHGVEPAAGLAVAEALARAVPGGHARLPWPSSPRLLSPAMLTEAVNSWLDVTNAGDSQHAVCLGAGTTAGLLPNPRWGSGDVTDAAGGEPIEHRSQLLDRMRAWHSSGGGLLLLTGSPGTGKTWLLQQFADTLGTAGPTAPAVLRVQAGAVHEVARQLALRLGLDPAGPATVDDVLRAADGRRVTLLIDAFDRADERSRRELVLTLVLPLVSVQTARVVVASAGLGPLRPPADPLGVLLGGAAVHLDLDADEHATATVAAAVRRRLADAPASPYRDHPGAAQAVAAAVAEAAHGVIAVGAWVARRLAVLPQPLAADDEQVLSIVRQGAAGWADRMLERLGDDRKVAEAVLRPLAWVDGQGLTPGETWLRLVTALGGELPSGFDTGRVRAVAVRCSPLLRGEPGGRSGVRLLHPLVAEHLRRTTPLEEEVAHQRVFAALRPPAGGWGAADAYTRTHLAAHAERAGSLPEFMDDLDALVHLEPATTLPLVRRLPRRRRRWGANLYMRAGSTLLNRDRAGRRLLFDVLQWQGSRPEQRALARADGRDEPAYPLLWATGGQAGDFEVLRNGPEIVDGLGAVPGADGAWLVVVSTFRRTARRGPVEHQLEFRALDGEVSRVIRTGLSHRCEALVHVAARGGPLLVAAGDFDVLRAWGPDDPRPRWMAPSAEAVRYLAVVPSAAGPVLASTSGRGGVQLWDAHDGTRIGYLASPAGGAAAVAGLRVGAANVVGVSTVTGHLAFWDVDTQRSLGAFRPEEVWSTLAGVQADAGPLWVGVRGDGRLECRDGRNGLRLALSRRSVVDPLAEAAIALGNGGVAALAVVDGPRVSVWDPRTLDQRATMTGHAGRVVGVDTVLDAEDGELLVTAGSDGTVRSWGLPGRSRVWSFGSASDENDYSDLFAGKIGPRAVVVGGTVGDLVVLDALTGERLHEHPEPRANTGDGMSYRPETRALLPAGDDLLALSGQRGRTQEVWSLVDRTWYGVPLDATGPAEVSAVVHPGAPVLLAVARGQDPVALITLQGDHVVTLDESLGGRSAVAVQGGGERLLMVDLGARWVCCDVATGGVRQRFGPVPGARDLLAAVASGDGVHVLVRTSDGAALLGPLGQHALDPDLWCAAAVDVGGRMLLAAGVGEDVVVLEPGSARQLARLPFVGHVRAVVSPLPGVLTVLAANRLVTVRLPAEALLD